MPTEYSSALLEHFRKHNQFLPSIMPVKFKQLLSISENAWDNFINEMVVTLVYNRLGKEVTPFNHVHEIINNKTKKNITALCNKLNHVVKVEYLNHRDALRPKSIEVVKEEIVISTQEDSLKHSFWPRFLSIFKKKNAATA